MEGLKPPRCLNLNSSNMSEEWKNWKQSFETYMVASGGNEKSDLVKIAILLHVLGEETMRIYDTLDITEDEKKVYATVMTKINNYFVPQVNTSVETYKFNCRVQGQSETFDSFVTDLKRMSALCDFGNARDRLIKDKIVQGVCDQNLKRKLLAEANLTLASAVKMGRAAEQTQQQLETMERQSLSVETIQKNNEQYARKSTGSSWQGNKVQQPSASKAYQKKGSTSTPVRGCGKCGLKHEWGQCPAFGKTCRKCKALNHFARMCKSKLVYEVNTDSEDDGDCFMGSIQVEKTVNSIDYNKNDWYQIVELTDCDKRVKFKLDTVAQVNVLHMSKLKQMKVEQNIVHSNVTLRTFANTKIPVVGKITLQCKANDRIKNLEFQIVDFDKSFSILGLKGIEKLDLLQRSVSEIKLETVFSTHRDLFRGIGDISIKKCKIVLKDDAVPKVSACRKIPFKLRDKVKDELNRMEKLNIIQKVTAPTDWVNPIVVVNKPDKNVRICLDPFELNNAIKREHFKLIFVQLFLNDDLDPPPLCNKQLKATARSGH
ncbi:hypothetical protein R5R35_006836 [Gryllus longicercus]|uniref:Uncharacterized protein n=1 Tax=Gryllus longicercus TaxID=2509291 RepID=A0AAN9VNQ5_9ORTH